MGTCTSRIPVRLVVEDDCERSRLTVFFRLLLAIPHLDLVRALDGPGDLSPRSSTGSIALFTGRLPVGLHRLLLRLHPLPRRTSAPTSDLVANPYPQFTGDPGSYPIDIRLPAEPVAQPRWTILVRLAARDPGAARRPARWPAGGANVGSSRSRRREASRRRRRALVACAFLGWFASVAHGRMPKGLRDAGAYSIGYSAQLTAYLLLVTDRYPNADPTALLSALERPAAPSGARRRRSVRPAPVAAHRLLPAAARAARTSSGSRSGESSRSSRRSCSGSSRSSAARPRVLSIASSRRYIRYRLHVIRLPLARGESVPRLHRDAGHVPTRSRARGPAAAEPLEDGLPARARGPAP